MKLLSYFSGIGNSYILGPDSGGEAILVDPSEFDVTLVDLVESNSFNISTVLFTHSHEHHIRGLRVLKKIYDVRIISGNKEIGGFESELADKGERIEASGYIIETLDLEELLEGIRIFRIESLLFTGTLLSAGRIEAVIPSEKRALLAKSIQKKITEISKEVLILPSYGPPSTADAELRWNSDFHPQY